VGAFLTTGSILAGCDDGPRYLRFVEEQSPRLAKAFMLRNSVGKFWLHAMHLQALLKCVDPRASHKTSALLAKARITLRSMRRLQAPEGLAAADYFDAWIHLAEGNRAGALHAARKAHTVLVKADQPHQTMTLYLVGALEGGDSGRAMCAEARASFEAEGWRNWRRGLAMRLPGRVDFLERTKAP
jgi:hypothetical protein